MATGQPHSELIPSWRRSLRASNRSERTIDSYLLAANQLTDYLATEGLPEDTADIEADPIRGFLSQILATRASATARQRYASLKQLFKWLWEEGEIAVDPIERVKPPKVVERPVPVLSDDELKAFIRACEGRRFGDRRDEAIVRLFIATGMRLGELAGLTLEEVDLDLEVVVVLGKGRRLRSVPFGKSTTRALDRYIRGRRQHKDAEDPWLWLDLKGRLSDSGIEQMIARRARSRRGARTRAASYPLRVRFLVDANLSRRTGSLRVSVPTTHSDSSRSGICARDGTRALAPVNV